VLQLRGRRLLRGVHGHHAAVGHEVVAVCAGGVLLLQREQLLLLVVRELALLGPLLLALRVLRLLAGVLRALLRRLLLLRRVPVRRGAADGCARARRVRLRLCLSLSLGVCVCVCVCGLVLGEVGHVLLLLLLLLLLLRRRELRQSTRLGTRLRELLGCVLMGLLGDGDGGDGALRVSGG
jgi:hypothetical protein